MKKWKKVSLYTSIFLALNFLCKELTDDFSIGHLFQPVPQNSFPQMNDPENLSSMLHQKYTYLGKGNQAFVFLSEDGEYVLKLFRPLFPSFYYTLFGKSHRIRPVKFPFAKTILEKIYAKEFSDQKRKDLQSFVNAFTWVKEETQLEYLHLEKTNHLKHTLKIYDKINSLHSLDLDNTCFLIQKKTNLLYPTLASLIQRNELDKAKQLISAFVDLSSGLIAKGVDNPTSIERNLGCMGLQPVQIDVGRVFMAKDLDASCKANQLTHSARHMSKWLTRKAPNLVPYLEETIEKKKEAFIQGT